MTIESLVAAIASVLLALSACESPPDQDGVPAAQVDASEVKQYVAEIVRRIPHDPTAFTQGLVLRGGLLYESTGRYGPAAQRLW
jgi:glutamine cyclotransferase